MTAQEACDRLSSTLSSLEADMEALQIVSSLMHHLPDSPELQNQLIELASTVSSLEQKHQALQEIVYEEQKALDQIEQFIVQGKEQNEQLQRILEQVKSEQTQEQQQAIETGTVATKQTPTKIPSLRRSNDNIQRSGDRSKTSDVVIKTRAARPDSLDHKSAHDDCSDNHTEATNEHTHHYAQYAHVCLKRIRQKELDSIPRTIRGRISLAVLIEASLEIETVCRDKYLYYKKPAWWESEPWEHPWVSEQELRKSCAFFRSGESTARAILQLLRKLQRIKQVPGKNLEVIYILPMNENEEE